MLMQQQLDEVCEFTHRYLRESASKNNQSWSKDFPRSAEYRWQHTLNVLQNAERILQEELLESILHELLPFKDVEGYIVDYDHYMSLNVNHVCPALPFPTTFLVITAIYAWRDNGLSKQVDFKIIKVVVFRDQGEMELYKFKEAVNSDYPLPIFN